MFITIADRIYLPLLLPPNAGSLAEMVAMGEFRNLVQLSDHDKAAIDLKVLSGGSISWDATKAADYEFDMTPTPEILACLGNGLRLLEQRGSVPADAGFYSLYQKLQDAGIPSCDS